MDRARMEPIASCYAVLLHDAQFRSTITSPSASRTARPTLQLPAARNREGGQVARLRGLFAQMRFARIVKSAAD